MRADAVERFLNRRTLEALGRRLEEGEGVAKAVQGERGGRRGLLVATDFRLFWVQERRLRRVLVEAMRSADASIQIQAHGRTAVLQIVGDGQAWRLEGVLAGSASALEAHVSGRAGPPTLPTDKQSGDREAEARRLGRVEDLARKGRLGRREAEWFKGR